MDDLRHLLSAYFYELWDEHEYDSWEHAVDDFVRRSAVATPLPKATDSGYWPCVTASARRPLTRTCTGPEAAAALEATGR